MAVRSWALALRIQWVGDGAARGWFALAGAAIRQQLILGLLAVAALGWMAAGAFPQTVAVGSAVPASPEDPVAAKAYAVLDRYCATCHQTGRIAEGKRPFGGIGNILDLNAVAADRRLVMPGLPEASPLFTSMLSRAMPPPAAEGDEDISSESITAVRAWLLRSAAGQVDCGRRNFAIRPADLDRLNAYFQDNRLATTRTTRFVLLGRVDATCDDKASVAAATAALSFALNSLSWAPRPSLPKAINAEGSLLAIDLSALGWSVDQWETLAGSSPYTAYVEPSEVLRFATGSRFPVVRGDWLIATALRAPSYYDLLGLPDTVIGLGAMLQLGSLSGNGMRFGVLKSDVARGQRLVERYRSNEVRTDQRSIWLSGEFAAKAGRSELGSARGSVPDKSLLWDSSGADARLFRFELPNGLNGYFAADAEGRRLREVPVTILSDVARPNTPVVVGQGCMRCHGGHGAGLQAGRVDELAERLKAGAGSIEKDERERLLQYHRGGEVITRVLTEEAGRYRSALSDAGVGRVSNAIGETPHTELNDRYWRPLSLADAEAELGLTLRDLIALRSRLSAAAYDVLKRLEFGLVSRTDFEGFATDVAVARDPEAAVGLPRISDRKRAPQADRIDLQMIAQASRAGIDDTLTLKVTADRGCNLTLVGVDPAGRATVLFPSDFEQNNALEAGVSRSIPASGAAYRLRFKQKGTETVIGVCSPAFKLMDGIRPDYEKQRFTILGNYRAFLLRSWDNADDDTEGERRAVRSRTDRKLRRTNGGVLQGRTAIEIRVE